MAPPKTDRRCVIPLCDMAHLAQGYCRKHYTAWRKYGDPLVLKQKQHHGLTLRERFLIYAKQGPGCWEWVGYRDPHGYGRMDIDNRPMLAHRISYIIRYGDIPAGMDVLHKCDHPRCVNPEHLFLGTQADNVRDMHEKGRARKRGKKGVEHHQAKLTVAKVRAIRRSTEIARVIAARYGISSTQVYDIRKRRSWAHITDT